MRRYPLSFRSQVYQEANFYQLTPLVRKLVAPGDTITTMIADARFVSAVFAKTITNPVLAQIWYFYVPHRLVWDQWMDFIALDDAITSTPTTTTEWIAMFEPSTTSKSSLFRRSYKLIYNQYFGDEKSGQASGAWYDNIADDTFVTLGRLLAWDQYRASEANMANYTQNAFTITGVTTTASIPLDDFARAVRANTARRRQKVTGDKYVDTMRMMGVELSWQIQMAPEYLGSGQAILMPRERAGSGDATSLATRVSEWSGKLQATLKKRCSFAEHGYIIGLMGFRPSYLMQGTAALDVGVNAQEEFYRPDTDRIMDTVSSGPNLRARERYAPYLKGINVVGVNANGNALTVASGSAPFYPDPTGYTPVAGGGVSHMGATADVSIKGLTVIPSSRA